METHNTGESVTRCEYCGEVIQTDDWHPALIVKNDESHVLTFCEPKCRNNWQQQPPEETPK
ncbi:DUF7576 family protein [Natrarchaeobius chitinivorans]